MSSFINIEPEYYPLEQITKVVKPKKSLEKNKTSKYSSILCCTWVSFFTLCFLLIISYVFHIRQQYLYDVKICNISNVDDGWCTVCVNENCHSQYPCPSNSSGLHVCYGLDDMYYSPDKIIESNKDFEIIITISSCLPLLTMMISLMLLSIKCF